MSLSSHLKSGHRGSANATWAEVTIFTRASIINRDLASGPDTALIFGCSPGHKSILDEQGEVLAEGLRHRPVWRRPGLPRCLDRTAESIGVGSGDAFSLGKSISIESGT